MPVYPERAERGAPPAFAAGHSAASGAPPALCVGARTELHEFSCHDPAQHARSVVGGCVVAALDGGWLVRLDQPSEIFGGLFVEGPGFLPPGSCPNAVADEREAAA